ncbi:MAG: LLM class F420-dependent oxidoreductase [Chloroflexi bacterium]|nr:LLM class F420-dependent oxidoreductase [Chloroflexota bacterium]
MTDRPPRLGFTIPFDGLPLRRHQDILRQAEMAGFTDAWTSEVDGLDGFTPLALAALATERLRLGVAIAGAFTRGPALLAMTAAGLAELAPGRFCLGLGTSSGVIVEQWNSLRFERPLARLADVVTVVREALRGEKVEKELATIAVRGFRLSRPVHSEVPIFLAALRPRALHLAGAVGDGVILNWLAARDVPKALAEVDRGAAERKWAGTVEPACRVFVCPGEEEAAERVARRTIAAYLTVPVYATFHRWLGRGPALEPMMAAWRDGRRREATALLPDEVVRELVLTGTPKEVRAGLEAYRAAGVRTIILQLIPTASESEARAQQCVEALWALAPSSGE